MRALAFEELSHVSGGDRWGDNHLVAREGIDQFTASGYQTVQVIGRRDGGSLSLGDAIAAGSLIGAAYGGYTAYVAGAGIAEIGGAIAIGGVVGGAAGVAFLVLSAGAIYVLAPYFRAPNPLAAIP